MFQVAFSFGTSVIIVIVTMRITFGMLGFWQFYDFNNVLGVCLMAMTNVRFMSPLLAMAIYYVGI